jgi:hypothetical protein
MKPYPNLVCSDCGLKASKGKCFSMSCYHSNTCDVCQEVKAVTQPRDFYYPKFKGHEFKAVIYYKGMPLI